MKKGLTELVFVLDRSGSMHGLEADTIGGFNSMIDKQKKEDGDYHPASLIYNPELRTAYYSDLEEVRRCVQSIL